MSRWRSLFSNSLTRSERPEHLRLGEAGEKLAAKFLRRRGYKILYRNFKPRSGGQIDLVCRDRDTLVFVEVKTRSREEFGRPFDFLHEDQKRRISRGALAWLRMLDHPDINVRFDVVEVLLRRGKKPRCEVLRNAFPLAEPYRY